MMAGERPPSRMWLGILLVATAVVYLLGLSWAPIYPHFDEIRFAEQARSVANTGLDVSGRFLPVYFQMDGRVWFHPVGVYLPALAFKILPVSTFALRAPTAIVGVLNVLLLCLIARRVFRHRGLELLAGALLAITPAHFIHSRMAVDYLFPIPFVLGWLLLLLRFLETRAPWALFGSASLLGLGLYSYIAAIALMPLFAFVTLTLLWVERAGPRALAIAVAGFCWPVVPGALFVVRHPEMLGATLGRYGIEAAQLDLFQRLRETFTPWFLSDRANLYASFFSPGYLFITGGGSLVGSTRTAGILLLFTLPLMLVGLRALLIRYSPAAVLTLAGLLLPAVAASVVNEQFAVGRALTMVPFAVLMAVYGVQACSAARLPARLPNLLAVVGSGLAVVSLAYVLYRLSSGALTPGGVIAGGVAGLLLMLGWTMRRTKRLWPLTAALLFACLIQFPIFLNDYFGDYRARSAFWFNGNLKGAVARIVAEIEVHPDTPVVVLDQGVAIVDWYWRFHLAELNRSDLAPLARMTSRGDLASLRLASGALLLLPADNYDELVAAQRLRLLATITDPDAHSQNASGQHPSYLLFQAP